MFWVLFWVLASICLTWTAVCGKWRIIEGIGRFASFSPECSACLQKTTHPFLCMFPFCVREEWSCWLMSGAFMYRRELQDFGLCGSKSCHYICSAFSVFSFIVLEQLLELFVSDTWPLPLSAHVDQGCQSVLSKEIWLDCWFTSFHFLELLWCLFVTGRICSFQTLGIVLCEFKTTSTALVFIQLHYYLESILK